MSDLFDELIKYCNSLCLTNDDDARQISNLSGQAPAEILQHILNKEYSISADEFFTEHESQPFDLDELKRQFKIICEDFLQPLLPDVKSQAVEFCSKMIYEVGPESRKVSGKVLWKFIFVYNKNNSLVTKTAFVCTEAKQYSDGDTIILTVKPAMLLAILVLEQINELSMNNEEILLTPLAAAVFSKKDIPKIARELDTQLISVINTINASCYFTGHYLANSTMHCALVAVIFARNLQEKDKPIRDGILAKTFKQYIAQKKVWDPIKFGVYAKYAKRGFRLPDFLKPEKLIEQLELVQARKHLSSSEY